MIEGNHKDYLDRRLDRIIFLDKVSYDLNSSSNHMYGDRLSLSTEGITETIKDWVVSKKKKVEKAISMYRSGYNRLKDKVDNLPDEVGTLNKEIKLGGWALPLFDDLNFDPKHLSIYVEKKLILKDLAREMQVVTDKSQDSGLSKLVAEDKFKRVGVDKATAKTIKLARLSKLKFVSGETIYVLPGSTIIALYHNRNGSTDLAWRQIPFSPEMTNLSNTLDVNENGQVIVNGLSEEDYKDTKKTLKELLAIYSARISGHSEVSDKIEELSDKVSENDGKQKRRYTKELQNIIDLEEAITSDIKRSIEALLKYVEVSIK